MSSLILHPHTKKQSINICLHANLFLNTYFCEVPVRQLLLTAVAGDRSLDSHAAERGLDQQTRPIQSSY